MGSDKTIGTVACLILAIWLLISHRHSVHSILWILVSESVVVHRIWWMIDQASVVVHSIWWMPLSEFAAVHSILCTWFVGCLAIPLVVRRLS